MANQKAISVSKALALVDTPEGRARVAECVARQPFPHFEQHTAIKDALIRIDAGGKRTAGRFVNHVFVELE